MTKKKKQQHREMRNNTKLVFIGVVVDARCYRESCPIPIPIPISCRLLLPPYDHRHSASSSSSSSLIIDATWAARVEFAWAQYDWVELGWSELSSVELSRVGFWYGFSWEIVGLCFVLCGIGLFGFSVWLPLQRKRQIREENALISLICQLIE